MQCRTIIFELKTFPVFISQTKVEKGKVRWNLFCCKIYLLQKWPLWNTKMTEMFWKIIGSRESKWLICQNLSFGMLFICVRAIMYNLYYICTKSIYVFFHILYNICVCWRRDWIDGTLIQQQKRDSFSGSASQVFFQIKFFPTFQAA